MSKYNKILIMLILIILSWVKIFIIMFQKQLLLVGLKKIWNNKEIIIDHYLLNYKDQNSKKF